MNRIALTLLLCLVTVPATAGDLPVMRLGAPWDAPGEIATKYSQFTNIVVAGSVTPPIESDVTISAYEVREGGCLFKVLGTSTKLDSHGRFQTHLLPSARGWPIGKIRVVATLDGLAQVKQATTIETIKMHDVPAEGIETKEFEHSDIIVDTEQPNGPYQVIGGNTFLIRGRFVRKGGLKGNQGPTVVANIVLPAKPGKHGEITFQNLAAISLPEDEPDHFWYEILIDAPSKSENYKLRIDHNWAQPGGPQAPAKQLKDGFDLHVGLGPAKPDGK